MPLNGSGAMATADPPIAVVAAEARELAGLIAHATSVTALRWPVRYAIEADIGGRRWLLLANGAGTALAAQAAEAALAAGPVRALISTGLCGGLDPALETGDLVAATEVLTDGDGVPRYATAALPPAPALRLSGPVICSSRVASTAAEKAALRAAGAVAVEMESAGVAEAATRARVPFHCIKGVSDTAAESLPLDFNRYRDPDGRFLAGRIAVAALLHPHRLPALVHLFRASRRTSLNLGDFLADCQF
jgi:adenosylhomocysteine nucleosidase